jgi:hypothetical protein
VRAKVRLVQCEHTKSGVVEDHVPSVLQEQEDVRQEDIRQGLCHMWDVNQWDGEFLYTVQEMLLLYALLEFFKTHIVATEVLHEPLVAL